jgi:hypothetical protein
MKATQKPYPLLGRNTGAANNDATQRFGRIYGVIVIGRVVQRHAAELTKLIIGTA